MELNERNRDSQDYNEYESWVAILANFSISLVLKSNKIIAQINKINIMQHTDVKMSILTFFTTLKKVCPSILFERIIQSESVCMSVRLLIRLHVQEDFVSKTPLSYFFFVLMYHMCVIL